MKSRLLIVFGMFLLVSFLAFAIDNPDKPNSELTWVEIGSALNINCMISQISASDDGCIYFGCYGKGLFKSEDNGTSWSRIVLGDGALDNGMTSAVFAHPNGNVYAGQTNGTVFVSIDGGNTFRELMLFNSSNPKVADFADDKNGNAYFVFASGESLVYDPSGKCLQTNMIEHFNSIIWSMDVAGDGSVYLSTMGEGAFKSTNLGANWSAINSGLPDFDVHKIRCSPDGELFAGLSGSAGLHKSSDKGQSWTSIQGFEGLIVMDIIFGKNKTMFVATTKDIFRSDDSGETWTSVKNDLPDLTNYRSIALDTKNYLYVGSLTGKLYRTKDPVETETDYISINIFPLPPLTKYVGDIINYIVFVKDYADNPVENAEIHIFNDISGNTDIVYTNIEGEAEYSYRIPVTAQLKDYYLKFSAKKTGYANSEELTRQVTALSKEAWTKIASYNHGNRILSIMSLPQQTIMLGTSGSGVIETEDNCNSWFYAINGMSAINSVFEISRDSKQNIYLATDWDGVVKSTDKGNSWKKLTNGFDHTTCLAIDDNDVLFAYSQTGTSQSGAMYRSDNEGKDWTELQQFPIVAFVNDLMTYNFKSAGKIFAACGESGLKFSSDNGMNWHNIPINIENLPINTLAQDNHGGIYAGSETNGVYYSGDGGVIWNELNTGIEDFNVKKIICDEGNIYISAFGKGVWMSSDKGQSWTEFNLGFESLSFKDVYGFESSADGYLYAGAFDKGLYKRKKPAPTSVNNEKSTSKFNLYVNPLPVNNLAHISFETQSDGQADISIYNLSGIRIAVLANGFFGKGNHKLSWDTSELPSGIYFIRLAVFGAGETITVVVNK